MAEENEQTRNAQFLNDLSDDDALALWDKVESGMLSNLEASSELPDDFSCYAPLDPQGLSGAHLRDFITCRIVTGGKGILMEKYPRFQVQFNRTDDGSYRTPQKATGGVRPIGWQLKDILSSEGWERFRRLINVGPNKTPEKVSIKVMLHHIAYNHRRRVAGMAPIPAGTGVGTSISHLCDKSRCNNLLHHCPASEHQANLVRQRCPGMTVFALDGVIMQVDNCPHYESDDDGNVVSPNCTRLSVTQLDPTVYKAFNDELYSTAHAKYLSNKESQRSQIRRLSL